MNVDIFDVSPSFCPWFQDLKDSKIKKHELIKWLANSGFQSIHAGDIWTYKNDPRDDFAAEVFNGYSDEVKSILSFNIYCVEDYEKAVALGIKHLVYGLSISESYSQALLKRTVDSSINELLTIISKSAVCADIKIRVNLETCFYCPYAGKIDPSKIENVLDKILSKYSDIELCLSDEMGRATPDQVDKLFRKLTVRYSSTSVRWAFQGQDSYGMGICNIMAAYQNGVRTFGASVGGIGVGSNSAVADLNTVSEDLIFMFERMGVNTNVDVQKLLVVADRAAMLTGMGLNGRVRLLPRSRTFF
ncbi:MAG: hypothetical protein MJK13_01490 [Pseudomonadales bacterium]|nr:hypothetical protein [Pseudomonadales bacterium]